MKRSFNVAGPSRSDLHYMIPAERRLPEAPRLVEQMGYFVVHAPRQTGKTTALRDLAERLTASGRYAAVHFSCEVAEVAGDDYVEAQRAVLDQIRFWAGLMLPAELQPPPFPDASGLNLLHTAISAWAAACPRPLVLIFDEIDALRGQSLLAVLRQLRSGYAARPGGFASSVILCGLRDVRDYKVASGGDPNRLGTSSPFNIKVESLRVGDFDESELRELYAQHTADTGQVFTEEALLRAWEVTAGQPWLVNAVGREIVEKIAVPPSEPITALHVDAAKERLILARATHLDSLASKLMEPRVRRVIEPLLAGAKDVDAATYNDDVAYVRDLGLVAVRPLRIANPIYREVIVRVLTDVVEDRVTDEPAKFVLPDGRIAFRRMLRAFAAFWSEHGAALAVRMPYAEVSPPLILMAFMQRIVNGGGYIDREYGVGRGRIDLLVRYPYKKADGTLAVQRRGVEIKVWRKGQSDPLKRGLDQLDGYLEQLGMRRGTLVIFDARAKLAKKRVRFNKAKTKSGRAVTVVRA
ncbi:MAG: AAA family ATPase [Minicystis sp.]